MVREANARYEARDYAGAAARFEEALRLGLPDPDLKRLALDSLVDVYGPDKLDDPAAAELILRDLVGSVSDDVTPLFALSSLYERTGDYQRAERALLDARDAQPGDSRIYLQLAQFYERGGEFERMMEALEERARRDSQNPEHYYTIATFYWEKAYRDFTVSETARRELAQLGLDAIDRALSLRPDYFEALTYKNLLLRALATLETDPTRKQGITLEADQWRDRATEARDKQRGNPRLP